MRHNLTSLPALACFRIAAELQSFSKAADRLNLTHGAVSRAVGLLEDDLGTLLFERRNRGVFLTDAGRKLAQVVARGLGDIEDEVQSIRAQNAKPTLTVSCEPTLLMRWLIPQMPLFHAANPAADIRLLAGGGPVTLGSGVDLAIRRNDFKWPAPYHARHLFDERIGPVCRPDKVADYFVGDRLRQDATLLHTRTRPSAWSTWADRAGQLCPTAQGQDFEHFYFSLQAAVAGLGVAIGPWHLVQTDLRDGLLVAPQGFHEDGSGYFVLAAREPKIGSIAQVFADWLSAICSAQRISQSNQIQPRGASLRAPSGPLRNGA